MKIFKSLLILACIILVVHPAVSQDYEEYTIEKFYKKVDLDYGVLDEGGDDIDFVFVPTDIDQGTYEVEIADGPGDLYEIKGTDYYCTFRGYYDYTGYGDEGILKVESSSYYSTFFKKE